ncbi:MAG TPA: universal stress protein [Candidatus Binatia bacterium]|jgi:nucleotide-binding universal stress UspA family protein
MFKRILVAYDGSDGAKFALDKVTEMAEAAAAELLLLAVGRIPEYAETVSEAEEAREQAKSYYSKIMEDAADRLRQQGLSATVRIDFGKPGDVILRIAEESGADLIALGTNPHSAMRRRFLGATVDKVVDRAHCSVLVVRRETAE